MDRQYRVLGIAMGVYGALSLLIAMIAYGFFLSLQTPNTPVLYIIYGFLVLNLVIHFLALLTGIYLGKGNSAVHKFALPISVFLLFSVPMGTVIGTMYLWLRLQRPPYN
ncbi:hypothetical protein V1358_14265 [Pseudoalteromonas sp. YIC-656]|uniref:hypothetical protein n=1 Tax=Pseudoalteromonas pernae TaxID=3118054 RepID=UPI0032420103